MYINTDIDSLIYIYIYIIVTISLRSTKPHVDQFSQWTSPSHSSLPASQEKPPASRLELLFGTRQAIDLQGGRLSINWFKAKFTRNTPFDKSMVSGGFSLKPTHWLSHVDCECCDLLGILNSFLRCVRPSVTGGVRLFECLPSFVCIMCLPSVWGLQSYSGVIWIIQEPLEAERFEIQLTIYLCSPPTSHLEHILSNNCHEFWSTLGKVGWQSSRPSTWY